jgi:hypothetical protein
VETTLPENDLFSANQGDRNTIPCLLVYMEPYYVRNKHICASQSEENFGSLPWVVIAVQ